MSVVLRRAREGELDEVARVLAAVFEGQLQAPAAALDPASAGVRARYLEEIVNVRARLAQAELFVAVEAGRIVGTGTLYPPGRAREYADAMHATPWPDGWASLRLLAVHPEHRGRGIGRMLLDARVERARALDASAVALHTSRDFARAREMFQRWGWTRVPDFDHTPAPGVCAEAYVLRF